MQPAQPVSAEQRPAQPKRRRWPAILAIGFVAVIIMGGLSFVVASTLEDHDTFCTTCHTAPETTYFNRAYLSLDNPKNMPLDLASWHYLNAQSKQLTPFSCITCHRGDAQLPDRLQTLALGGRDTVIFVLGRDNPAIEKTHTSEGWLSNASCVSCHTDTLLTLKGLDSHFHNRLPQAATALANGGALKVGASVPKENGDLMLQAGLQTVQVSILCSDCHQPHKALPATGSAKPYLPNDAVNEACLACHKAAGKGPQDVLHLYQ